ncbi:hypothetical protein ACES2L_06125 [Bdellovibrio bacteriovorus]
MNKKLLKRLVFEAGGLEKAQDLTGKSKSILSQLANGTYKRIVKEDTRIQICEGFDVEQDELFPFADGEQKVS